MIGELGQINTGASGLDPQYVIDVLGRIVNPGISSGHSGVTGWMWKWCDENNMVGSYDPDGDFTTINEYGQLYIDYYYTKVGSVPPTVNPTPVGKPGDANGDGVVNESDYTIWAGNYGRTNATGPSQGDFNADGRVNDLDYTIWANNYGK
jgi:hypothetical protein